MWTFVWGIVVLWVTLVAVVMVCWVVGEVIECLVRALFSKRRHVHVWPAHPETVMRCQDCGEATTLWQESER